MERQIDLLLNASNGNVYSHIQSSFNNAFKILKHFALEFPNLNVRNGNKRNHYDFKTIAIFYTYFIRCPINYFEEM